MSEADAQLPTTLGVIESALFRSAPPVTIGRFEVVQQLGRGGMGVVYSARDPALKRDVAIKVHRGDGGESGNARLRREAETLAQLRHRNVVTVFEVGESASREVFVVMELLTGPTLRRWIETEQPTVAQILDVFTRCARGLQAAHDISLVHRDFKPDNVIVDRDAEPRIIDFGLARAEVNGGGVATDDGDDCITRDGTLVGTPRYMAPELRNGDAPTPASDQFAFAVALFESIAGVPPFADERYEPPKRPPRLPRRWWSVVERALDPIASRRWPSMGALADRFERGQLPRFSPRLRLLGALTTGAAVAAIGSFALGGATESTPASVPPITASATANEPCEPGTELLDGELPWIADDDARASANELAIDLRAGPPRFVTTSLPAQSFRDRAIEFEVERLPARDTAHELFLSVRNAEDEAFSVLVWGGQWVFPMAPNTHGLALEIDREQDRFFRIQIRDQRSLPDIVTFEYSSDGEVWTPIARVEGSIGMGRIVVSVGSHDPIEKGDRAILRSIRCTELQPVAPLPEDRDLAREESSLGDPPRRP